MIHIYLKSNEFRNESFGTSFVEISCNNIFRRRYLRLIVLFFLQVSFINTSFSQSTNQNYIVTTVPTMSVADPTVLSDANSNSTIQYFDGLGRSIESIQKGVSGTTGNDLVSFTEYDGIGREYKHWLPVTSTGAGAYVPQTSFVANNLGLYGGDANPYATTEYEPSPLNRVTGQLGAGAAWNNPNSPKKVKTEYGTNTASEVTYFYANNSTQLALGNGTTNFYAANALYKTQITDEDGKTVTEFKDKLGRVIMKQSSTDVKTYYVYNDLGQLSFVLPPSASDALATMTTALSATNDNSLGRLGYAYQYDERGNCILKKLPGCDPILMVYDKANRLILSQDGNQRVKSPAQWTVIKYDILGRVIMTGITNSITSSQTDLITTYKSDLIVETCTNGVYSNSKFTDASQLTVSYYDNYDFITYNTSLNALNYDATKEQDGYTVRYASAKGLLTGTKTAILDGSGFVYSAQYYDFHTWVVQSRATNYLGGADIVCNAYNFSGKPTQTLKIHNIGGQSAVNERYTFTYDKALRPLVTNYYLNGATTAVTLTDNTNGYDELGRLVSRKRHTGADNETYTYNIRNWTTTINSGTYLEQLYYNTLPTGATGTPCYNGNISYQISGINVAALKPFYNYAYTYSYDNLNRLCTAYCYKFNTSQGAAAGHKEEYNYDKEGNINYLMRGNISTTVDYLSFTYNGNQITSIFDYAGSQNSYATKEYQNKANTTNEMAYDPNGNLTKDLDRDIVTIKYNVLNLPDIIQFRTGDKIVNTYDAGGQKLRSDYYTYSLKTTIPLSLSAGDINNIVYTPTNYTYTGTVYLDNKEYAINKVNTPVNGIYPEFYSFVRMYTTEGYLTTLGNPQYYYYRKDHLGNNREVWCATTNTTVQKTQYYPSGLPWAESSGASAQNRKYNDKEWIEMSGLDNYDYGARLYYPAVPHLTSIDPLCEKYYSISPYAYCAGNPVNRVDPDGMDWTITSDIDKDGVTHFHILFTGAVVDETSDQKGQADKLAETITSQFQTLFNQDKSHDESGGFTVDATAVIRSVDSEDNIAKNETVFKIVDPNNNDLKYKDKKGNLGYAAGVMLDGKEIAINEDAVPFMISGKNNKTITHEMGHTAGLHHPEDDDNWFAGFWGQPGYGMQRSGNNFMFGGGSKQNPQIIKNPTGPTNRQLFYMLKLYNNGKLNRKDIDPMK